jgi:hypothetical protein
MTCAMMLDQLLEADLPELSGIGDSAVAAHVRECPRCRAVAEQLVRDTTALASATAPTRRVGRRKLGVAAVGLAAAILFVVVVRARPSATSTGARSPNDSVVVAASSGRSSTVAATGASASELAPTSGMNPRRLRHEPPRRSAGSRQAAIVLAATAEPVRVDAVRAEPMTPAASVAPVRLDAVPTNAPLGLGVRVDPPAGMHARVLRTANPGVTVVWLSESPSTGPQP